MSRSGTRRTGGDGPSAAEHSSTMRGRMVFTGICLGLGMLAATVEVFVLQAFQGEDMRREARRNYVRDVMLDGWRGDIVDRDGALLAATVHRWFVSADPSHIRAEDAPLTASVLGELLQRNPEVLEDKLMAHRSTRASSEFVDPSTAVARRVVEPITRRVSKLFGSGSRGDTKRMERKLRLLEYFYKMDQLRARSIYRLVDTLASVGDTTMRVFDSSAEELGFFRTPARRFTYLAGDLDDAQKRMIEAAKTRLAEQARRCRADRSRFRLGSAAGTPERCFNPLAAVQLGQEPRRYYAKRELGTQLIGLVGKHGRALEGIERAADGILRGGQHTTRVVRDIRGKSMVLEGIQEDAPLMAPTVELTIDQEIQSLAEQALTHACQSAGARAGYAVVMGVETGEVLGAATFPTFNPNTYRQFFRDRQPLDDERDALQQSLTDLEWASAWPLMDHAYSDKAEAVILEERRAITRQQSAFMEHAHAFPSAARHTAFQDMYEPGSIMKVFTLAAWLDQTIHPLSYTYSLMDGAWEIGDADDNVIHDDHRHHQDDGDVAYAIQVSSNIIFGQMGLDLERHHREGAGPGLDRYLRAFGFGAVTSSGLPGESRGILRPGEQWRTVETANIAFGQGVAATGIQLVTALSALGNGGKLMRPLLVRRVLDGHGREIRSWEPTLIRQVVTPRTARTVLDLLRAVVEPGGTGTRASIPEYPVAGKTGTGQKTHLRSGKGYADNMWVGTFFGVAPADKPELAVIVLVDEPQGKRYGGVVAAPAFREIMRGSLRLLGVASPMDLGKQVAWIDPDTLAKRRSQPPRQRANLSTARPPIDPTSSGDVPVPAFEGMTMDQVRRMASEVGLRVRMRGSGTATWQDVGAHTRLPAWSPVTVRFVPQAPGALILETAEAKPHAGTEPSPAGTASLRGGGVL